MHIRNHVTYTVRNRVIYPQLFKEMLLRNGISAYLQSKFFLAACNFKKDPQRHIRISTVKIFSSSL
jgi:hypothetical protein